MKRKLEGEKQRKHLLFCIEDHPGLSEYELAQKLGWTRGKLHYHLKILFNQGELKKQLLSTNPHPKRVYFVVPWEEMVRKDGDSH